MVPVRSHFVFTLIELKLLLGLTIYFKTYNLKRTLSRICHMLLEIERHILNMAKVHGEDKKVSWEFTQLNVGFMFQYYLSLHATSSYE